jgi:anti-anti-sigma factor
MAACGMRALRRHGDIVLVFEGELDLSAGALVLLARDAWAGRESGGFWMDLRGITFIDVAGLEVLFEVQRAVAASPPIRLVGASVPVRRLISLLGLEEWFSLELADSAEGS